MDGLCGNVSAQRPDAVQLTTFSKGRVERTIQYVRHRFFAARPFTTLEDFNRQTLA